MKLSSLVLVPALLPAVCYAGLALSALHTSLHIGHWPTYNNPDPHHLPIYRFAAIAMLTGLAATVLLPFFGFLSVCIGWAAKKSSSAALWIAGTCYAIGAAFWTIDFVCHRIGLGGLVDWIAD